MADTMRYTFLGPAFSFKCLLSPVVKLDLYRTFVCPVLRSGLAALVLKNTLIYPLSIFQRKTLKGVLKLSTQSSTTAIHFLTGELPIEAKLHKDVFSLFYSVWANPNTKIHEIVNYLLASSNENSRTWSNYLRQISKQYGLVDPLISIRKDPPTKTIYKTDVNIRIQAFHENELRRNGTLNKKLKYFNVSMLGLSGRHHPALSGLVTTTDVQKSRFHLKMLVGDLYTYETKSEQSGGSPHCRLCSTCESESVCHILTRCIAYDEVRTRILEEYAFLCIQSSSGVNFSEIVSDPNILCQFILDPTSMNLQRRINLNDPLLGSFFQVSRYLCFSINERRIKFLDFKKKCL